MAIKDGVHPKALAMTYRSLRRGYISAPGRDAEVHPEK
jgi:hypothetical protein